MSEFENNIGERFFAAQEIGQFALYRSALAANPFTAIKPHEVGDVLNGPANLNTYLASPSGKETQLAAVHMHGSWKRADAIESDLAYRGVQVLKNVGFTVNLVKRCSGTPTKVRVIAGSTGVPKILALQRSRLWAHADKVDLPAGHPYSHLGIYKHAWCGIDIAQLRKHDEAAARDIATAVIASDLQSVEYIPQRAFIPAAAFAKGALSLGIFVDALEDTENNARLLEQADKHIALYGVSPAAVLGRLFGDPVNVAYLRKSSVAIIEQALADRSDLLIAAAAEFTVAPKQPIVVPSDVEWRQEPLHALQPEPVRRPQLQRLVGS